jgi:exopolysaccharide biosynthesis polyprenyl glycosylphosphotransferase
VRLYLRILTLVLPALSYFVAVKIRFGINFFFSRTPPSGLPSYGGILLLTTIIWALSAEEAGCWNVEQLYSPGGKSRRLLEALAFTYAIVMAAAFLYRGASYSRVVIGISAGALFVFATMERIGFRVFLEFLRKRHKNPIRVLIVGTDRFARKVAASLEHGEVLSCRIAGFVRLPDQEIGVEGPVYEFDNIPKFSNGDSITDVIVAVPPQRLSEVRDMTASLQKLCAPTRLVLDLGETVGIRNRLINLGGIQMLDLRSTLAESGSYLFQKRVFDVVFSAMFLLITLPATTAIAIAIKLTSHGPIFFVQDRVGLNGRVFRMIKFRTMKLGSREECDTRWTSPNDPRRTAVGAFLRHMNLAELPQFLNVLVGAMSIVGPRPERPHFVECFLEPFDRYNARHMFKVGITGWAQVNGGRGDTSIAKRVEFDLYYLRNWSLTFDLQIIIMTFLSIFNSQNAY